MSKQGCTDTKYTDEADDKGNELLALDVEVASAACIDA